MGERVQGRSRRRFGSIRTPVMRRRLPNRRARREITFQPRFESPVQPAWTPVPVRPVATLVACLLLAAASGCKDEDTSADGKGGWDSKPATVEVTQIQPQPLRDTVVLSGSLAADSEVLILSEIDGVVASIEFSEGHPVSQGDVLFLLRPEEQDALLLEAQADMRLAQDVYDRTQRLTRQDVSSMARRQEASSKVDKARARVALAELEVQRTRIRAPFDGMTGQRRVSVGDRVDEKVGMVTVASVDRLQLLFSITEQAAGLARTGVPILVRVGAWPGEYFPGEVYFVSPSVDTASRSLLLKAWIPNADHRLKPGMFANVDVVIAEREDALLVPESALIYDRNGTYLWRVDDEDHAEKIPIEIGLRQAGKVEILKGIAAGDRIVSAGTNKVRAGSEINAVAPQTAVTSEKASSEAREPREGDT